MRMMNVPDRIVLRGGDSYEGFEAEPLELMDDRASRVKEVISEKCPSLTAVRKRAVLSERSSRSAEHYNTGGKSLLGQRRSKCECELDWIQNF